MDNQQIAKRTVTVLELADAAVKKASTDLDVFQKAAQAASQHIPACIDTLQQLGLITPDMREKAAAALSDHRRTLLLLQQVANLKRQDASVIGTPLRKDAGSNGRPALKESDRIWEAQFGSAQA